MKDVGFMILKCNVFHLLFTPFFPLRSFLYCSLSLVITPWSTFQASGMRHWSSFSKQSETNETSFFSHVTKWSPTEGGNSWYWYLPYFKQTEIVLSSWKLWNCYSHCTFICSVFFTRNWDFKISRLISLTRYTAVHKM